MNRLSNSLYTDFNLNSKKMISDIKCHSKLIYCLCTLHDGRLALGSINEGIIIYNKMIFKPELIIKNYDNKGLLYIVELSSNILASSWFFEIIFFKIEKNNYEKIQTLKWHSSNVYKILELKNKNLISCSDDYSIIFYKKGNNNNIIYRKYYKVKTGQVYSIIQTKENEICYFEFNYKSSFLCFYDLNNRKIKKTIWGLSDGVSNSTFNMITKNLLIFGGKNEIYIIDINKYKIVKKIDSPHSNYNVGFCMINEKMFLTGDYLGTIRQWIIEGGNIRLISKKENAHDSKILTLVKVRKRNLASCSYESIKIW